MEISEEVKKKCLEFLPKVDEKNKARERENIQKKGYITEEEDTLVIFESGVGVGWVIWAKENPEVRYTLSVNHKTNPNEILKNMTREEQKKYAIYVDFLRLFWENVRNEEARKRQERAEEDKPKSKFIEKDRVVLNNPHFSAQIVETDEGIILDVFHRHGDLIQSYTFWNEDTKE